MAESISGYAPITDTPLGDIATTAPYVDSWREILPSGSTQNQLGDTLGAFNVGNMGGISYTIAGIDPVIVFLLTVRLRTTGQIWPLGYS